MSSAETVEIADCVVCASHRLEVCGECDFDGREDNDLTFGLEPSARAPLDIPATSANKDGA
ncbi:hypothetical protein FRC10_001423 [Ceratobasidium sp. 414]|nr:hypothetical protein FRC10_001423 [Ceratobasidium sp. 414]